MMHKKTIIFAAFVATLTAIAQKYVVVLVGILAMAALSNLLGLLNALRGQEKVSGRKALMGTARLVFYLAFYTLVLLALEGVASYIIPPILAVGFLYEATIALRKAVALGIIPSSLLQMFVRTFNKHAKSDTEAS